MPIFQKSVLNKYLKEQDKEYVLNVYHTFKRDYHKAAIQQKSLGQTLKAEIEETDKEIDQMVYEMYGLTKEEIRIVNGVNQQFFN